MVKKINIYDAKTQLSRLVERAAAGEEIVIAKAGRPKAKLVAFRENAKPREPGCLKGRMWVADDFDAALPDGLLDAFEGHGK
jgi:prevent-host-death family protein